MNRKIGMIGSAVNLAAVGGFALSMLWGFDAGSYFSSMFIAFSFVLMMCGFAHIAEGDVKLAGYVSHLCSHHSCGVLCAVDDRSTRRTDAAGENAA